MISSWFRQGLLCGHQRAPGGWLWIRLTPEELSRLDGSAVWQPEMIPLANAPKILGMTDGELRDTIRSGHFAAYRLHHDGAWHWYLLPAQTNPLA